MPTQREIDNKIKDRVHRIIVAGGMSPEAAAAKIAEVIIKANEVAFVMEQIKSDMKLSETPYCVEDYDFAIDDLGLERI